MYCNFFFWPIVWQLKKQQINNSRLKDTHNSSLNKYKDLFLFFFICYNFGITVPTHVSGV